MAIKNKEGDGKNTPGLLKQLILLIHFPVHFVKLIVR